MSNHLKGCSCKQCKTGKHAGPKATRPVRFAVRRDRHNAKQALKEGAEPQRATSTGYTD
jgi:hypothetical protein